MACCTRAVEQVVEPDEDAATKRKTLAAAKARAHPSRRSLSRLIRLRRSGGREMRDSSQHFANGQREGDNFHNILSRSGLPTRWKVVRERLRQHGPWGLMRDHMRIGITLDGLKEHIASLPKDAVQRAEKLAGRPMNPSLDGYAHHALLEEAAKTDGLSAIERMRRAPGSGSSSSSSCFGTPTVFVSWWLGTPLANILDALEWWLVEHKMDPTQTFFWFSNIAIRQWPPEETNNDVIELGPMVALIGQTVMLIEPEWSSPAPLKRAWCLLEIFRTAECEASFHVALSRQNAARFRGALEGDYHDILQALSSLDVRKAESFHPADKEWILELAERIVGCSELNTQVLSLIRTALSALALRFVDALPATERGGHPLTKCVAGFLQDFGDYDAAERLYRGMLTHRTAAMGESHPDTLAAMNWLAQLLAEGQGELEPAIELASTALRLQETSIGEEAAPTLRTCNNLALMLKHKGELDEAEKLARRAMLARRKTLGAEHRETLTSLGLLASIHRDRPTPDLVQAETLYRELVEAQSRTLGKRHPHTLASIGNLVDVLRMAGQIDEATSVLGDSIDVAREVLGPTHVITLCTEARAARLLCASKDGRMEEGVEALGKVVRQMSEHLGSEHPQTTKYREALLEQYHGHVAGRSSIADPDDEKDRSISLSDVPEHLLADGYSFRSSMSGRQSMSRRLSASGRLSSFEEVVQAAQEAQRTSRQSRAFSICTSFDELSMMASRYQDVDEVDLWEPPAAAPQGTSIV